MTPPTDAVTGHRLSELERDVQKLQDSAVSKDWLDERFDRLNEKIDGVIQTDRNRRLAMYTAVITGIISLVSALVLVAVTLPGGV